MVLVDFDAGPAFWRPIVAVPARNEAQPLKAATFFSVGCNRAPATAGDVAQQKPIGSKPISGRKAYGPSRISSARRKPTIFDAVSRASDAVTLASRHSVTAGESCDGSTVADVCDIVGCDGVTPSAQ